MRLWKGRRVRQLRKKNPRRGSTFDDFLREEGIHAEVTAKAVKKVIAWQIAQAMKEEGVTKAVMVRRMKTSKSQLDRLLDPGNQSVTLRTVARAGAVLGKRVRIELTDI